MTAPIADQPSERSALRLAGGLLVGGILLNAVATAFHPTGDEDDHEEIFAEYADSGAWEALHLLQLAGVLAALAGLLVLYRALTARGEVRVLASLAAGATVITAACMAMLQAVDGVALKQAVDAWTDASGAQEAIRFADAESVRWLEWGVQSYFRVLLGLSLVLFGAAIVATRLVPRWLGWVAVLSGLLSVANGIDVGYNGLESGFQDVAIGASQLAILVFAVGVLVTGVRHRDSPAHAQSP
jgi:hypothetical protein